MFGLYAYFMFIYPGLPVYVSGKKIPQMERVLRISVLTGHLTPELSDCKGCEVSSRDAH